MPGIRGTIGKVPVMVFGDAFIGRPWLREGSFVRSVEWAPSPAALDFEFDLRKSAPKDRIDQ